MACIAKGIFDEPLLVYRYRSGTRISTQVSQIGTHALMLYLWDNFFFEKYFVLSLRPCSIKWHPWPKVITYNFLFGKLTVWKPYTCSKILCFETKFLLFLIWDQPPLQCIQSACFYAQVGKVSVRIRETVSLFWTHSGTNKRQPQKPNPKLGYIDGLSFFIQVLVFFLFLLEIGNAFREEKVRLSNFQQSTFSPIPALWQKIVVSR